MKGNRGMVYEFGGNWVLPIYFYLFDFFLFAYLFLAFLVAQLVKESACNGETQVQSLGQEDPLEKEMATHSSILALQFLWTEEPGRLQCMGWQRVRHN